MTVQDVKPLSPTAARLAAWQKVFGKQSWAGGAEQPLVTRINRVSRLISQQLEDYIGMPTAQVRILYAVLDENGVSQSDLHKLLKTDRASITRSVQSMERDGLITRQVDPDDNRLMRVYITPKGRAMTETLLPRIAEVERRLVYGMQDSEILQLHALLGRLEERLEQQN